MKKTALIFSVDKYPAASHIRKLRYAAADARELSQVLKALCGFEPHVFKDEEATSRGITEAIKEHGGKLDADDLLFLAFFGHGTEIQGEEPSQFYIAYDATLNWQTSYLPLDALIRDVNKNLKVKQRVIVVDACRDELSDADEAEQPAARSLTPRNIAVETIDGEARSTILIQSCSGSEKAHEADEYAHSIFAKYLLEAIRNVNFTPKGEISGWHNGELECRFLGETVRDAVIDKEGRAQTPFVSWGENRIILARRGDVRAWPRQPKLRRPEIARALAYAGLIMVAGVVVFLISRDDHRTYCSINGREETNVVLIHARENLSDLARGNVTNELKTIATSMPPQGHLELRQLDTAVPGGRPLFDECKPNDAHPDTSRDGSGPTHDWLQRFLDRVDASLPVATPGAAVPSMAPIMETIKQIAADRLSMIKAGSPISLFVVSDFVQDTPNYSQRQGDLSFQKFMSTPAYFALHPDLKRAKVHTYHLADTTNADIDVNALTVFWIQWFSDGNAVWMDTTLIRGNQ